MNQTHADSNRLAYGRIEAAEILGVSPDTIDKLRKRGLLKCSVATRRPLFPHWELERFLRETSAEIVPEPETRPDCFSRNGPRQGANRSGRKVERSSRAIPCDEQDLDNAPEGPEGKSQGGRQ
jgi:hypothetical protein